MPRLLADLLLLLAVLLASSCPTSLGTEPAEVLPHHDTPAARS
jgi:hypothetical protein